MGSLRVLRVIHDLQVGGVQRQMFRSAMSLAGCDVETEVCCVRECGPLAGEFEAAGIPVHEIKFRSRLDPRGLFALRQLISRGRYDVVHAHMYSASMAVNLACFGLCGPRIINSHHSTIPVRSRGQERRLRRAGWMPDSIVAVSESVGASLVKLGLPASKISIIHNGIDLRALPRPVPVRDSAARALRLVWAGRFVEQKQLPLLIEVMAECRRQRVDAHLTLVGDGAVRSQLQELVRAQALEDFVTLPGMTTNVRHYLDAADLYVSASQREGFPNSLLEACAAGRGMLLSGIEPHKELVGQSIAGELLNDSPGEWARLIGELGNDRGRVRLMGGAAREVVLRYSIHETTRRMLDLYDSMQRIGRPRSRGLVSKLSFGATSTTA